MYTKHHTEGVVIGAFDTGEADQTLALFTRDLGLVYARVQSVRELKSKNRYALQILSLAHISLVQGKGGWKVTNVEAQHSLFCQTRNTKPKARVVSNVTQLVKRLVKGEEAHEALYESVTQGFDFLLKTPLTASQIRRVEILMVLRVLYLLGYVKHDKVFLDFLRESSVYTEDDIDTVAHIEQKALYEINQSIHATQL